MSRATSTKLTYEDYAALPDDGKRYEIIDGELYVNPAPLTRHQFVLHALHIVIGNYLEETGRGFILFAPVDVLFSPSTVVQPDFVVVMRERRAIITEKNIDGAPDLVAEIISESSRRTDEIVKRHVYERGGVGEYWVIDPVIDAIRVHRRVGNAYERAIVLSAQTNDTLSSPLFPGLSIDLARVFAER